MTKTAKLSNILLATVLGASASAALAQNDATTAQANAAANAAAYDKIFNQSTTGGQGGNVSGGSVSAVSTDNSTTITILPYVAPKILKESYKLGPCSGSAYQALWQTVKFSSLYRERAVDGLTETTPNSFTIRQYRTESDADRTWAAKMIDEKVKPKPVVPVATISNTFTSANQTTTTTGGGQGGNVSGGATGGNSITYTVPQTYKDVTYHCTLGK